MNINNLFISLLFVSIILSSCSTTSPVLKDGNITRHENDVLEIKEPHWKVNHPWYGGAISSIGGAYLGYSSNYLVVGNENNNQLLSAVTGAITGYSIWYLTTHLNIFGIKPHNYVYKLPGNKDEIDDWLQKFNKEYDKNIKNYRIIHNNPSSDYCYELTLINIDIKESEFTARNLNDANYFIKAWNNPTPENVKRIAFDVLNYSLSFPSNQKDKWSELKTSKDIINIYGYKAFNTVIEDVHLEFCENAKLCKEFADLYPHRFNDAEEKAYNLIEFSKNKNKIFSSNQDEKAREFLQYFSNSSKKSFIMAELKDYTYRGNQEKDYKSCKSIYDYDKFINKYDLDNYDPNGYVRNAKQKLVADLKKEFSNLANYVDVFERFISDYNNIKYYEGKKIISEAKEKVFNIAFNSCKTWIDYEKFINEYENKGYSNDNSKIAEAKEKLYILLYQSCSSIQDYEFFIERYSSCVDCPEVINAKEKVFELSFNNCQNFSDYENFYNKFKDLNYSSNNEKLSQARYNGYKMRYESARASYEYTAFIELYTNYDPDKLILDAKNKRTLAELKEELERIEAEEAARLAEIARQNEERERRCKTARIVFDYGGTFFLSPSGDKSFSSDLISRNCTVTKGNYGIILNNNSYGYCDCILGQYQINYSYIVTNLSGEPVKSISNSFILKIDGSADEYTILIDYDDGTVISVIKI